MNLIEKNLISLNVVKYVDYLQLFFKPNGIELRRSSLLLECSCSLTHTHTHSLTYTYMLNLIKVQNSIFLLSESAKY